MVRLSVNTILLSIISLASATSPLLAWTNKNVAGVSSMNVAKMEDVPNLLNPFLEECPKSVLIIDQDNADASSVMEMISIKKAIESAKSSIEVPYLDIDEANNIDVVVNAITKKCSNVVISDDQQEVGNSIKINRLPKNAENQIKNLLKGVNDDTLVVYLSNNRFSAKKMLVQRQEAPAAPTDATPAPTGTTTPAAPAATGTEATPAATQTGNAPGNTNNNANANIVEETTTFGKYVFFNNAVFECLVALAPVLLISIIGVTWLSSVQTPSRFEKKKDN